MVIAFITAQYEKRYAGVWQQFIAMTCGQNLRGQPDAGTTRVTFRVGDQRSVVVTSGVEAIADGSNVPAATGICIPISEDELCPPLRSWRGDDKKGRYRHSGAVRLLESPSISDCSGVARQNRPLNWWDAIALTCMHFSRTVTSNRIQPPATFGCSLCTREMPSTFSPEGRCGCAWDT